MKVSNNNLYKSGTDISLIKELRKEIFRMMHYSKSSHIGGCLSCIDILYTLYFKIMDCEKIKEKSPDRDIFILSKGHNRPHYESISSRSRMNGVLWMLARQMKTLGIKDLVFASSSADHVECADVNSTSGKIIFISSSFLSLSCQ